MPPVTNQLGLEFHVEGLGFGRTLETDWVGGGTEMGLGLVGVGVRGRGTCRVSWASFAVSVWRQYSWFVGL